MNDSESRTEATIAHRLVIVTMISQALRLKLELFGQVQRMITSRARYTKLKYIQLSGTTNLTLMENANISQSSYQKAPRNLTPYAA